MCPQCRDSSVREWEGDERENKREEERHQYRNTDIYRGSEGDEGESTKGSTTSSGAKDARCFGREKYRSNATDHKINEDEAKRVELISEGLIMDPLFLLCLTRKEIKIQILL